MKKFIVALMTVFAFSAVSFANDANHEHAAKKSHKKSTKTETTHESDAHGSTTEQKSETKEKTHNE